MRRTRYAAVVAAIGMLLAACGGGSDGGSGAASGEAATIDDVDRSAEFRFGIQYGWSAFGDPHRGVAEGDAVWYRPIYERLLTFAPTEDGGIELAPQLATDWETSEDGLSLTFELREGVTFHDGTPFDAEAVKANLERATGPDSTVAGALASIESIEVVDEHTVALHLAHPDPELPWSLSWGLPGLMVSPAAFDTDLEANPVGTGPYRLVSIQKDADAVYERWDGHWDPDAALTERLTISTVFDANARYNGLRNDEFDAVYLTTPLDAESRSLTDEGYHWVQGLSPISFGVLMNPDEPPFDDVRVRRAVNLAINRTEISEELLDGLLPPTSQAFNAGYVGHDPDLPADAYDPDEARRLVEEAGAQGASFEILHATSEPGNSMVAVVQQALADIGLEAEPVPLSPSEQAPEWRRGGHAAALAHIIGQPEPSSTLRLSYLPDEGSLSNNPAETVDPELEELFEEGTRLPVGSEEREALYREISNYLFEHPIHAPIVQFGSVTVCRPEVVGCENLFELGRFEWRGIGVTG
ncbi:MAG TPA: ABC transporter substrate-binding protein [Acidimicrobiales bacterium]